MAEPVRLPPEEVREKITSAEALLVCAYDDEDKFRDNHLEGALSLAEFKSELPALPKDKEIIFYCA
jgi:rhodanese-related sulfurtransferase